MAHHDHYVDGEYYPSVTTILAGRPKPWLDKWREKWGVLADRKLQCANAVGTVFHWYAEHLAQGDEMLEPGNRRLLGMVRRFDEWVAASGVKVKEVELHVVSKEHKYAGTFDAVGTLPGSRALVLFDWKTSAGIYPDMELQLAAYAQAYKEQTGIEIKKGVIVLVGKDKPSHRLIVKEYKLGKRPIKAFLKRLEAFRKYSIQRKEPTCNTSAEKEDSVRISARSWNPE